MAAPVHSHVRASDVQLQGEEKSRGTLAAALTQVLRRGAVACDSILIHGAL